MRLSAGPTLGRAHLSSQSVSDRDATVQSAPPETPPEPAAIARRPLRKEAIAAGASLLRGVPISPVTWRNHRLELSASFFLAFVLAVVDSSIIGVLVRTGFEGVVSERWLNFAVAVLSASTSAANVVSFVWARLSHGREKVRFVNTLQVAMIVLVAAIGLAPRSGGGLVWIIFSVIAARLCWAGFITVRATIWSRNYERVDRARLAGRIAAVQVLTAAGLGVTLGTVMEHDPGAFRFLFPIGAVVAIGGAWCWSRIRIRRGRAMVREELAAGRESAPSLNPADVIRVLRADTMYARFMLCMFLLGLGNLTVSAPLIVILREQFDMGYQGGIIVANSLPLAMMPISIPIWRRLLDRVHVIRFRAIHSWCFAVAAVFFLVGVATHTTALMYIATAIQGLAFGGGVLAWNLGHLDFAPAHRATQYMGVHVTLTGARGLLAPFVGIGLYDYVKTLTAGSDDPVGHAAVAVFSLCLLLSLSGAIGFGLLSRLLVDGRLPRNAPLEAAAPSVGQT